MHPQPQGSLSTAGKGAAARVAPRGQHPGDMVTPPMLDSGASSCRQERAPQRQILGVPLTKPRGFRRPLARLPVQLGFLGGLLPHSQAPAARPPTAGPIFPCPGHVVQVRGAGGGQGARKGPQGGEGWSDSSLWQSACFARGGSQTSTCGHSTPPNSAEVLVTPLHQESKRAREQLRI